METGCKEMNGAVWYGFIMFVGLRIHMIQTLIGNGLNCLDFIILVIGVVGILYRYDMIAFVLNNK